MTNTVIDPYAYPARGLDRLAATRYLGFSPGAFDTLVGTGRLPRPRRIGDEAVWNHADLDDAFAALPVDPQPASDPLPGSIAPEQGPEHPRFYAPAMLAKRWACSGQVITAMIRRGELPAYRISERLVRIKATDVIAYEDANTIEPGKR